MTNKRLIEELADSVGDIPRSAEVLAVRQYSRDELHDRARRLLSKAGASVGRNWQKGDWDVRDDRTLIRLTEGARAVVMHGSGAMKIASGLDPMERPFSQTPDRDELTRLSQKVAGELALDTWVGELGSIRFERLWQIKAAAADRKGKVVDPVLFRIVGAFRHYVLDLPVWGPASAAVKLAGDAALDSLSVQIREPSGERIDQVRTISPERGAQGIAAQLETLMGPRHPSLDEVATPKWMRFGYLSLSKRKGQRLLEPVYTALVDVVGEYEAQGYLLVTAAADRTYVPFCRVGADAAVVGASRSL
jgi:hypothetical protein